jgi:hypothetical protein
MQDREERAMGVLIRVSLIISMVFLLVIGFSLAAVAAEIENLARGGDFEEGDIDRAKWNLNLGNAGVGVMAIDKKAAAIGNMSLFISGIGFDPAESWKPQIDQAGMQILAAGVYTLSAFIKAEKPRKVGMYVEIPVNPWTKVPDVVVNVTTEWAEYFATGIPPGGTVTIGFKNEGEKPSYWIDGVRFYAGKYVPTEIGGVVKSVTDHDKLTSTWANIKAR